MIGLLLQATGETLLMVIAAGGVTAVVGLPLGVLLYATRPHHLLAQPLVWRLLTWIVNITRSIPFVILMMAVIPLTRLLTGTSIGTIAAIVPLSLCAIPFFARVAENALLAVNPGLVEAAKSMGARHVHIVAKVLLAEARPALVQGLTLTLINLVGYSAMAGAIGGGGLGDLAIRYGYQRFDVPMLLATIVIMVALVQLTQWAGDFFITRGRVA